MRRIFAIHEYELRHDTDSQEFESGQKFDAYFAIKHEFEKNIFVQRLSAELRRQGISALISTEEKHFVGVFDVIIINGRYSLTMSINKNGNKIIVEWKAGASLSLSQLERYLWACDVVIVVRVIMNQVIRIARSDIESHLIKSLEALSDRSLAIESDQNLQKIPGLYCKECRAKCCEFYREPVEENRTVCLSSESMQADLLSLFSNIDACVEDTIRIVISELKANETESAKT
jgi:hypothetical protein